MQRTVEVTLTVVVTCPPEPPPDPPSDPPSEELIRRAPITAPFETGAGSSLFKPLSLR